MVTFGSLAGTLCGRSTSPGLAWPEVQPSHGRVRLCLRTLTHAHGAVAAFARASGPSPVRGSGCRRAQGEGRRSQGVGGRVAETQAGVDRKRRGWRPHRATKRWLSVSKPLG